MNKSIPDDCTLNHNVYFSNQPFLAFQPSYKVFYYNAQDACASSFWYSDRSSADYAPLTRAASHMDQATHQSRPPNSHDRIRQNNRVRRYPPSLNPIREAQIFSMALTGSRLRALHNGPVNSGEAPSAGGTEEQPHFRFLTAEDVTHFRSLTGTHMMPL